MHPLASFTVMVYVPADNPVAVELVCPPGVQVYVYGAEEPVTTTEAVPVEPPLHNSPVSEVANVGTGMALIRAVSVKTEPQPWFIETVYVPGHRPVAV